MRHSLGEACEHGFGRPLWCEQTEPAAGAESLEVEADLRRRRRIRQVGKTGGLVDQRGACFAADDRADLAQGACYNDTFVEVALAP